MSSLAKSGLFSFPLSNGFTFIHEIRDNIGTSRPSYQNQKIADYAINKLNQTIAHSSRERRLSYKKLSASYSPLECLRLQLDGIYRDVRCCNVNVKWPMPLFKIKLNNSFDLTPKTGSLKGLEIQWEENILSKLVGDVHTLLILTEDKDPIDCALEIAIQYSIRLPIVIRDYRKTNVEHNKINRKAFWDAIIEYNKTDPITKLLFRFSQIRFLPQRFVS